MPLIPAFELRPEKRKCKRWRRPSGNTGIPQQYAGGWNDVWCLFSKKKRGLWWIMVTQQLSQLLGCWNTTYIIGAGAVFGHLFTLCVSTPTYHLPAILGYHLGTRLLTHRDFPWAFPEAKKGAVFVDPNDLPDDAEAPLFGLPHVTTNQFFTTKQRCNNWVISVICYIAFFGWVIILGYMFVPLRGLHQSSMPIHVLSLWKPWHVFHPSHCFRTFAG